MAAYALFMGRRLEQLRRVLKSTGSIYLHCDPTASHYLKLLMDSVFGAESFRNEIVWKRTGAHNSAKRYGPVHDSVLYYTKSSGYCWNQTYSPQEEYVAKRYTYTDDLGRRFYPVSLLAAGTRKGSSGMPWRGIDVTAKGNHWRYTIEKLEETDVSGDIYWPPKGTMPRLKMYVEDAKGELLQDWWGDISPINSQGRERLGYPTQKPLALLERIIQASSNEGDLVLDPFCGCGTAADAAAKLGRGYLGIDVSAIAVRVMEQRLASRGGKATPIVHKMSWDEYDWEDFERRALMHEADAEDGLPGWAWAEDKVAGLLNAVPNGKKVGDGGVDARYYTEKGEVIPIQVKMHQGQVGKPDMQKLLGVQTEWQNKQVRSPMSLMVTLYPPNNALRVYALQQGQVELRGDGYPKMQVLSVQEMLTKQVRPKLPPVDPRYFVGDTQTRLAV